jgi:hypothetical protein
MRQLMCTAVSQLRSDQLIPLHHYAHLLHPACLFFLYHISCIHNLPSYSNRLMISGCKYMQHMFASNGSRLLLIQSDSGSGTAEDCRHSTVLLGLPRQTLPVTMKH